MTHFDHDGVQRLFQLITTAVSIFMLIVLFYILQYIFDMEFVCSCKAGSYRNGVLYMMAPPLILTLLVNFIEPLHQKRTFSTCPWWRLCCKCCRSSNNCCGHVLKLFTRYIGLAAVWMSIVLFDGDWYFCLRTNHNKSQTGLPCKKDLTYSETLIKAAYKTESLNIGFGVICGFLFLWSLFEIRRAYCRMKRCTVSALCGNCWESCKDCCECSPYYAVVFEEILAEEVNNHLNKELEEIAKRRAKTICEQHLKVIEGNLLLLSNTADGNPNTDNTVSETWKKISAFDFYLPEKTKDVPVNRSASESFHEMSWSRNRSVTSQSSAGAAAETNLTIDNEKEPLLPLRVLS